MSRRTPRYGIPVLLSLLIHGLLAVALAAVPFAPKDMLAPPTIAVELIEPASPPVEVPQVQPVSPPPIPPLRKPVPPPIQPAVSKSPDVPISVPSSAEPEISSSEVQIPPSLSADVISPAISRPLPSMAGSARNPLLKDPVAKSNATSHSRAMAREGATPGPEYPLAARAAGWEGTVVMQVEVLPDGTAGAVTVYQSSGYPVLDQAALKAVKSWRFVPAMDGNFPVRSLVRIPVKFDLKSS